MTRENKVTRHDARIHRAAVDIGKQLSDLDLEPQQEENALNVMKGVFKALENETDTGQRDIQGIYRSARKAHSINKNK